MSSNTLGIAFIVCNVVAAAAMYTLPASPPSGASPQLDPAPLSISIEFTSFPTYMNNISATAKCLANLASVQGMIPALRIGGNTQDEVLWNPSSSSAATSASIFDPEFISLAAAYAGEITLGLNRKSNNLNNTVAAAIYAHEKMANLYALELGNEPDSYAGSPIAKSGTWSPAVDAASQVLYQQAVGNALNGEPIVQAGVFFNLPKYSAAELAPKEGASAKYVKSFSDHGYPQTACNGKSTDLTTLMSHSGIVSYTQKRYIPEVKAVEAIGKILHIAETNSASCGGGGISPTFGAALWIIDYVMQALIVGVKRLYFHQGGIGCAYCWWDSSSVASPYYGAYFVAEALGDADQVVMLDSGNTAYAVYAIYKNSKPVSIVLYNSDYYTSGARTAQTYTIQGLSGTTVTAKRLTAASATSRQDLGSTPTFGGQVFLDKTCEIGSDPVLEHTAVAGGTATFKVSASEALLISLN